LFTTASAGRLLFASFRRATLRKRSKILPVVALPECREKSVRTGVGQRVLVDHLAVNAWQGKHVCRERIIFLVSRFLLDAQQILLEGQRDSRLLGEDSFSLTDGCLMEGSFILTAGGPTAPP